MFKLIMMKANNYVNASQLCKLENKNFDDWKNEKDSRRYVEFCKRKLSESGNEKSQEIEIMQTVQPHGKIVNTYDVSGTYVHEVLLPAIATWTSNEFAFQSSEILMSLFLPQAKWKPENEIDCLKDIESLKNMKI